MARNPKVKLPNQMRYWHIRRRLHGSRSKSSLLAKSKSAVLAGLSCTLQAGTKCLQAPVIRVKEVQIRVSAFSNPSNITHSCWRTIKTVTRQPTIAEKSNFAARDTKTL